MKIIPYLVDWTEAKQGLQFTQKPNLKALGMGAYSFNFPDSYNLYMTIAEAYEQMRSSVPESIRPRVDQFMSCLITFDGYCQDLGDSPDLALSISPESALKLAYIGNQINWEGFKAIYDQACESYVKESLAQFKTGVSPSRSFEEIFAPYLKLWLNMINTAAMEERGIVVLWS